MASPFLFKRIGDSILQRNSSSNQRSFVALFGLWPLRIYQIWRLIQEETNPETICPKHLMWGLLFLRCYVKEEVLSTLVGATEKTVRKWIWIVIGKIAEIKSLVRN